SEVRTERKHPDAALGARDVPARSTIGPKRHVGEFFWLLLASWLLRAGTSRAPFVSNRRLLGVVSRGTGSELSARMVLASSRPVQRFKSSRVASRPGSMVGSK